MIETPQVLPGKQPFDLPGHSDLLSDLLGSMHLSEVVLFRAEFREPWSVVTPEACRLAQVLPIRTEHIVPFHVIVEGSCTVEIGGSAPARLAAGDALLMPYGDAHRLSGRDPAVEVPVATLLEPPPWPTIQRIRHGGSGALTRILCGFLQCDEPLFRPVLRGLPALLPVGPQTVAEREWLATTIRFTAHEADSPDPGARCVLSRLTEVMFVEILRKHMQRLPADEVGWLAALNDPVVGAALRWMHAAPQERWSVDSLSSRVGVSRTVLATRFKHYLDQPPMRYLTCWRLQLAAKRLKTSGAPMKAIVHQAGYESEAAFSRAFKRLYGLPPADWRRRQTVAPDDADIERPGRASPAASAVRAA